MSTIAPETVRASASAVDARGAAFLDAPVSGSVPTVEKGELTIMVGGAPRRLERARPVLDALAAKVFHVGATGDFKEQYSSSTEGVLQVLKQEKSVMEGEVLWAGVVGRRQGQRHRARRDLGHRRQHSRPTTSPWPATSASASTSSSKTASG